MVTRRQVLTLGSALPLLPLLVAAGLDSTELFAQANQQPNLDKDTLDFWLNRVRKPNQDLADGIQFKGPAIEAPAFVFYDATSKKFVVASDLPDTNLPQKGDATITVRVERFRPSLSDADAFNRAKTGSLRIDVGQTTPLPGLADALAWTSVAAFVPAANGHLPSLEKLQFDPGQSWGSPTSIPIPSGLGFWSWNFFLQRPESWWGKMISLFGKTSEVVFPLLGMPAIALTALKAVDKIIGYAQASESSNWLLRSVSTPFYATKDAKATLAGSDGIPLVGSGTYLVIPESQLASFGKSVDGLELQSGGYVVPKNTATFDKIDAASHTLTGVTYLAITVNSKVKVP